MNRKKQNICLITACALGILLAVHFILAGHQQRLNREFDALLADNLSAYTESQTNETQARIRDIKSTLEAITILIESSANPQNPQWLSPYLQELNRQKEYQITYLPLAALEDYQEEHNLPTISALLEGKDVVSDVRYSERLGGCYVYGIAIPVQVGGQTIGALRNLVYASTLIQSQQANTEDLSIQSFLLNPKGDAIPIRQDSPTFNLFEELEKAQIPEELIRQIQQDIQSKQSNTLSLGQQKDDFVMLSYAGLKYNDWTILNISRGSKVSGYYQTVLAASATMAVTIVAVVAAAVAALLLLQHRQRRVLALENERFQILADLSNDLTFEYDHRNDTLTLSKKNAAYFGSKQVHRGYRALLEQSGNLEQLEFFDRMTHRDCTNEEFLYQFSTGNRLWISCSTKIIRDPAGNAVDTIGKMTDISAQKAREAALREKADHDPLVNLYNKAAAEGRIRACLEAKDTSGFLFLVDIDHFKSLNDTFGHITGDLTIQAFAEALKTPFRADTDIVGRTGGDEFIVFMPHCKSAEIARRKAEAILKAVHAIDLPQLQGKALSASIGIAAFGPEDTSYDLLFDRADQAMYEAKRRGRNQFVLLTHT